MNHQIDPTTGARLPSGVAQKNFWNVALPILGMGMQYLNNQGAQRSANRAMRMQDQLTERQIRAADERWRIANEMRNAGYFDPTRAIAESNRLSLHEEGLSRGNMSGAMRIAGYAPGGDSEYRVRDDALDEKYKASRSAQNFQIARALRQEELAAFDPSYTASLNPAIGVQGDRMNFYNSQIGSLGGLMQGLGGMFPQAPGRSNGFDMAGRRSIARSLAQGFSY